MLSTTASRSKPKKDQIIISIIIAVQFLFSLFWLLTTPFAFNYGGAAVHPYAFLFLMAYWIVGLVSAILLRRKGSWRRIVAVVWNLLLAGYTLAHGMNWDWENPNTKFFCFFAIYGIFAIAYLATTAVTGRAGQADSFNKL
jgi:hypothetical protein